MLDGARTDRATDRLARARRRFVRVCFRDRTGLVVFLAALLFFSLTLRVDVFINDTNTLLNLVGAMTDGHLYIETIRWGEELGSPGLYQADGRVYGRNYGQVFFALPFYLALEALGLITDLRVVVIAGWCLLLVAFFDQMGAVLGRRDQLATVGSVVGVCLFGGNLAFASPLNRGASKILALQLSTMVAAAILAVLAYRLLGGVYGQSTGVTAGVGVFLATPVGFWAGIPKRHTLTALVTFLIVVSFYRSRESDLTAGTVRFRALSYVWVALFAWIHAPEAFVLFLALSMIDFLTTDSHDFERIAIIGVAFLVSLLPFLVTNLLVSGNPLEPPRMLPTYAVDSGTETVSSVLGNTPMDTTGRGESGGLTGVVRTGFSILSTFVLYVTTNLYTLTDIERVWSVLVQSNYSRSAVTNGKLLVIRLSVLESMPSLAALVLIPLAVIRGVRHKSWSTVRTGSLGPTDLLVATICALFFAVYWPKLPIHTSFTVRYLHPLYPLGLYALLRMPQVRRVITSERRLFIWSYSCMVMVGGQLLVVLVAAVPKTIGEAVQLHALLALAAAGAVVCWALSTLSGNDNARFGAVTLAASAAVGTLFLLLSGFIYYAYTTEYALPLSRVLSEVLSVL